jgi:XTP/dITP diphosphohydrolase
MILLKQDDKQSLGDSFIRLVEIMDELREKCPWDNKQTIQTLRSMTIEETYELADAISMESWPSIAEELGDLMLHLVFYARISKEQGQYNLTEIIAGICKKLIDRHPHIYGDTAQLGLDTVQNADDVKKNWEKIKLKEGKKSVLSGLPAALPSLVKSMRIQEKVKQVGFEWDHREQVWDKVQEELAELSEAVESADTSAMEEELGDVIFSLVNYARFLGLDAENALERTNRKFIDRFTRMESEAAAAGKSLHAMNLEEMDAMWNRIKKQK